MHGRQAAPSEIVDAAGTSVLEGAGGTLGAGAGLGPPGLLWSCPAVLALLVLSISGCQVLSRLCSAGAAGRGAQGQAVHSGAAASHACCLCLEVRALSLAQLAYP